MVQWDLAGTMLRKSIQVYWRYWTRIGPGDRQIR